MTEKKCPFVGYDSIRRNVEAPLVSMSMIIRTWYGSAAEVPVAGGLPARDIARAMLDAEAEALASCLGLFFSAWGRDPEYWKLWGTLNVGLCMWLYRRMVVGGYSARSSRLTRDEFKRGLEALSAAPEYVSWLTGRGLRDTDRSPAYNRIKQVITARLAQEGKKLVFPSPAWYSGSH